MEEDLREPKVFFDTGCTHPITTKVAVEGMKMEISPLRVVLVIIQANGELLKLLGTCRMFIEADNFGGRRMIDCAVIDVGEIKETIILLGYLKQWNLLHESFPH